MDVKYISSDWEKTKQGLGEFVGGGHWTLSPFATLNEICNNLDSVESLIRKYDSDGFVNFSYDNQKNKYYQLNEDFQALHLFVGEVGAIVDDVIDERFYKDMDKFVEAIRDLTIEEYKTTNRIGAMQKVNTDYIPSGEIPKVEITLDDLFGGENFYADQIKIEYDQIKEMHPDQEFTLEEYKQVALTTHAFEYTSIKDQQYNKEFWVSIAALVVIVGAALIFPPAGIALGAIYGTLELSTAVTGRDWVSRREVGTGERWFRGGLAPLDLIPGVSSVKKFAVLGRAGKLKQAATISLKTSPAMRLKDTVKGSVHTARLEGMKRMNQVKDFAKGRAVAVGKKLEKDIIDTAKGIDKGVTAFNRFRESALPNPKLATPDGAIVSGSKVKNSHAAENFFRAKIEDVKGIGKGSKGTDNELLSPNGSFIDSRLESNYANYLARKAKEGKLPKDRLEWKEARDYWLNDSPMARGNKFNKSVRKRRIYNYHEIHLENGKRLDSYDPIAKEIISRKATDLDMVDEKTYSAYLKEMNQKYSAETKIRSNRYPELDGRKLEGELILEIPASNKNLPDIERYKQIAKEYGIKLRFMEE